MGKSRKKRMLRAQIVLTFVFLLIGLCFVISDSDEETSQTGGAGWTSPDDLAHAKFAVITGSAFDPLSEGDDISAAIIHYMAPGLHYTYEEKINCVEGTIKAIMKTDE